MPAYRRLAVDERRRRLLALGTELFSRHAYGDLSMAAIARAAGISKPLLYHYFPSKQAYFAATLEQAVADLEERVRVDPALAPGAQLAGALDAFLAWVEEHADGYARLLEGAAGHAEVRELVAGVRAATAERILAGLEPGPPRPALRAAVHGWLSYVDGVLADWLAHRRDAGRGEIAAVLLAALRGAVAAAGAPGRLD